MKKISFLFLAALLLFAFGCKEDEPTGRVEVVFKGFFGPDPLMMYSADYPYEDDVRVKWQLFQFFLSDIHLTGKRDHPLSEIELISFEQIRDAAAADGGVRLVFEKVPARQYDQLSLWLGVKPELNQTKPTDYDPTVPLGVASNYWEDAGSYIFSKMEGNADLDGDGNFGEGKLTFHIGAGGGFHERLFPLNVEVRADKTTTIVLNVDLRKAFDNGQDHINFREITQFHGGQGISGFIQENLLMQGFTLR